jgi:penicillin amidase
MIALLGSPGSEWWDDTTTPSRETASDVIEVTLDAAGSQLRAALGAPERWAWGRLHELTAAEATFGTSGIGPLEWYFNMGPFALPGAAGALANNYYRSAAAYPNPDDPAYRPAGIDRLFRVINGPSYRLTIDMSDLEGARIVTSTGQSGNPFDRHYGDLIDPWASGGTVPLPWSAAAIGRATVSTLTLLP